MLLALHLLLLWASPLNLPEDVSVQPKLRVQFPVQYDDTQRREIKQLHLHVSTNQGKTWKQVVSMPPKAATIDYQVARDGLYWFALQIETSTGMLEPDKFNNPDDIVKVYVNSAQRPLGPKCLVPNGNIHAVGMAYVLAALKKIPIELPADVLELRINHIKFPVEYTAELRGRIKQLHLYVSTNAGKTWTRTTRAFPTEEWLIYKAARDGPCWFALQTEMQDGKLDPPQAKDFEHVQKVYFNTAKRNLVPAKAALELVPPPKE